MSDIFQPAPAVERAFGMSMGVQAHDVADFLPEQAAARLMALHQRTVDAHSGLPDSQDIMALSAAKLGHERRIAELLRPRPAGGFGLGELAPQVIVEGRKLDKVIAERTRLQQLDAERSPRWRAASQLEGSVLAWCREHSDAALDIVDDAPVQKLVNNGEAISAAVVRVRSKLAAIADELASVRSAPLPSKVAIERAVTQIKALSAAPDVAGCIDRGDPVGLPHVTLQALVRGGATPGLAHAETVNTLGVLIWLFEREITAKIAASIAQLARDGEALDDAQRATQEADLIGKMLDCERAECSLIRAAEARGELIDYRRETSPEAVLGVTAKRR